MQNDSTLIDRLMARVEFHFARQSEILENDMARSLGNIKLLSEIKDRNRAMSESLDRLEAVHKNS